MMFLFYLEVKILKIGQIRDFFTQSPSDFLHVSESNVLFSPLYHADIGTMYLSKLAKALLRDTFLISLLSDTLSKVN